MNGQAVNLNYLKSLSGGNDQFIVRIVNSFCSNAVPIIEDLVQAAERDDSETVAACAHKLKTMFRYIGAKQTADDLELLEGSTASLSSEKRIIEAERLHKVTLLTVQEANELIRQISEAGQQI